MIEEENNNFDKYKNLNEINEDKQVNDNSLHNSDKEENNETAGKKYKYPIKTKLGKKRERTKCETTTKDEKERIKEYSNSLSLSIK